jgi:GNAT superfamily N-acetyltransferase
VLVDSTIEAVDRFWAASLGCSPESLYARQTLVVPHAGLGDFHGIFLFLRNDLFAVSVPRTLLDRFRRSVERWSPAEIMQEDRVRSLVDCPVEQVVGPAFVGYTDGAAFCPALAGSARVLSPQDGPALTALRTACSALQWEHGGSQLGDQPVVGVDADRQLVAVAGYQLWSRVIAPIAVITHPDYRGRGYGKVVVSGLTQEVIRRGLVPQYRTLEANTPSMAIAQALGFHRYATTVAVLFGRRAGQVSFDG